MSFQSYLAPQSLDPNLDPAYWLNESKQTQVFTSFITRLYPLYPEHRPKITAKPGRITLLPHRYYNAWTRDGSDVCGRWLIADAVEAYSPRSLSHGDALGHEE